MADVSGWTFGKGSAFHVGPVVGRVTDTTARILIESSSDATAEVQVSAEDEPNANAGNEHRASHPHTQRVRGALTVLKHHHKPAGHAATTGTEAVEADGVAITFNESQHLKANKPTAFVLSNLPPGKRIRVSITLGSETREANFRTPSPERDSWHIGLVSCNKISTMKQIGLWEDFAKEAFDLDCTLHMGDQVYGDEDFGRKDKKDEEINKLPESQEGCWGKAQAIVTAEGVNGDFEPLRPKILEIYRELYRATWSHPPCASSLAGTSHLMMLDDHEIVDDLGDLAAHKLRNTWQYFVMTCGYQVYQEYQAQLNHHVADVTDSEQKAYWYTMLYPKVGIFSLDVRLQRSLHRHQMEDLDWKDHEYLGPRQMAEMKSVLNQDFAECTTLILLSPTPPLFLNAVATSILKPVAGDVVGSWGNADFRAEQLNFLQTLSDWQEAKPNRAVCMTAGDIHIGGFADVQLKKGAPLLNQIVASAIGNLPEGSTTALNLIGTAALTLGDMHFNMRVNHDSWVMEPNFGIVHIKPPKHTNAHHGLHRRPSHDGTAANAKNVNMADFGRPAIRGELFSKNSRVTNDFQYYLPTEGCATECHGCRCSIQ